MVHTIQIISISPATVEIKSWLNFFVGPQEEAVRAQHLLETSPTDGQYDEASPIRIHGALETSHRALHPRMLFYA